MLVLDTDVVSALIRRDRNRSVALWLRDREDDEMYLSSTTVSELIAGVMRLPEGRRRSEIDDGVAALVSSFSDRIVDFDFAAAFLYGRFVPDRFAIGRPIDRADAQIAACCLATGATLVTRNAKDFESIPGLKMINPWDLVGD